MRTVAETPVWSGSATLLCAAEAMCIEQKLREGMDECVVRVSEKTAAGREEAPGAWAMNHTGRKERREAGGRKKKSGLRRVLFKLLDVALLDLLHKRFAPEEVSAEIGAELAGHDEKLIVDHLRKRDGAARGNEVRAPLEHETRVPEDEEGEEGGSRSERCSAGAEKFGEAIEEDAEADDEKRRKRNEKAVAKGGDAGPIRITGDEEIKSQEGDKQRSAGERLPPPKEKETREGEDENGRPDEQAVVGREEHRPESGRAPEPVSEGDITGFEGASIDDITCEESRQQADQGDGCEEKMTQEESRDGRSFRTGAGGAAK